MDALGLVPPEIMRYVIARGKVGRHIDFDTGPALFQTADEYERLVVNPPSGLGEEMTRRQQVARDTQLAALRLSQIERSSDPSDSIAGVSFRHLAMLAQIKKSGDDEVWTSLRKSGHLDGEPSEALKIRLDRMRNWVEGPHFPEAARIDIAEIIPEKAVENLNLNHRKFLSELCKSLPECDWNDAAISKLIRDTTAETGIVNREAYEALYWVILGKSHGPRASSLMVEMDREQLIKLTDLHGTFGF
jgi:lysyl-tRNA synthetase class 1